MIDSDDKIDEPDDGLPDVGVDGEEIPDDLDVGDLDDLLADIDPDAIEEPDDEVND